MAQRPMPEKDIYPNNSDRARIRQEQGDSEKPKVRKVTKGKVIQKKKSAFKRIKEAFGIHESQGVLDYIFYDIIIPATKNMLMDSIANGAEMAIFGEARGRRDYRRGYSGSRYAYDQISYRGDDYGRNRDRRDRDYRERAPSGVRDYEDIIFATQSDAEDVLTGLLDIIDAYDEARVADLYDLAGITAEYTTGNFGWRNLSSARTKRVRDGYVLDLPRPIVL